MSGEKGKETVRRSPAPVAVALLIAVIPILYYAAYVLDRRPEIDDHRRVALDRAARRIESVLANAQGTVRNLVNELGKRPVDLPSYLEQQHVRYLTYVRGELPKDPLDLIVKLSSDSSGHRVDATWKEAQEDRELVFRVRVDRILEDIPTREVFDYLFLANEDGEVIHQLSGGSPWGMRSGLRFQNITGLRVDEEHKLTASELGGMSRLTRVKFLGREYQLFSQPLRVPPLLEDQESTKLVVCGVVSASRSWREAMLVSSWVVLLLALLIVFGILPWPFLKLRLMRKRERFHFADGYLLLASTAAILMLVTALLADAMTYWREPQTESLLKKLSREVEETMVTEFSRMSRQLTRFDADLPEDIVSEHSLKYPYLKSDLHLAAKASDGAAVTRPLIFKNVKHAFWADAKGDELAKVTARRATTPMVNVAKRPYFQHARIRRLWSLRGMSSGGLYVQTVRSLTTGEHETVLAMPSRHTKRLAGEVENSRAVVAAISEELSWTRRLLPPLGCGFAVFNDAGDVLYHSDERRALEEKIYDQVDHALRLRAAVESRTDRYFHSDYLTKPHDLYVRPFEELEKANWFILTFRDSDVLGTVNTEAMASTIGWLMFHLLVLVVLPSVILALFLWRRIRWLWPDPNKRDRYRSLAIGYFLAAVVFVVLLSVLDGWRLLFLSLLVPFLALVAMLRWLWKSPENAPAKKEGFLTWHIVQAVLLWVLVAILPVVGYFRYSWAEKVDYLLRLEQLHQTETLAERRNVVDDTYREIRGADVYRVGLKREMERDIFQEFRPAGAKSEEGLPTRFVRFMQRHKPVYGDFSAAMRYQVRDYVFPTRGGLPARFGLGFVAGVLLLVVAVVFWTRYSARRLFFAAIEYDPQAPPAAKRKDIRTRLREAFEGRGKAKQWETAERLTHRNGLQYQECWSHLDTDQKLVLMQLSREGMVNPQQRVSVRTLLKREVLGREPELWFTDPGFRAWVEKCPDQADVEDWEAETGWGWRQLRWLLVGGIVVLVGFVFVTQRLVFDVTLGLLSAALAAVPVLLRLATALGSSRPGSGGD